MSRTMRRRRVEKYRYRDWWRAERYHWDGYVTRTSVPQWFSTLYTRRDRLRNRNELRKWSYKDDLLLTKKPKDPVWDWW